MIQYPVLLDNGTLVRDAYEMEDYLCSCGFSISQARDIANTDYNAVEEMAFEIASKEDSEYELICDGYHQNVCGLYDELDAIISRLKSGKSGKGYTKIDIAYAIKNAMNCYDPR